MRAEFRVHRLNDQGLLKAQVIADCFERLLDDLESLVGPEGREMAIVRTKLEEASFFAKKGLANQPQHQAR